MIAGCVAEACRGPESFRALRGVLSSGSRMIVALRIVFGAITRKSSVTRQLSDGHPSTFRHGHVVFSVEVGFSANSAANSTSTENSTSRFYVPSQLSHQSQLILLDVAALGEDPAPWLHQTSQTWAIRLLRPRHPAMDTASHRGNRV